MPEEECQENEEVPPLVGVADNIHEAREEPKISIALMVFSDEMI